jgi:hypothetical protein
MDAAGIGRSGALFLGSIDDSPQFQVSGKVGAAGLGARVSLKALKEASLPLVRH